eukprot:TRINITY_DN1095_c0_g1_i21.p1 TRINITY_DN1095_c0_g1~~TRINITY_DN1095_c0_g1_i21.p1  ORF type:complete len:249 (-),score=13.60 TRINITY_DN1095_c0_g1_i21:142-888(-)
MNRRDNDSDSISGGFLDLQAGDAMSREVGQAIRDGRDVDPLLGSPVELNENYKTVSTGASTLNTIDLEPPLNDSKSLFSSQETRPSFFLINQFCELVRIPFLFTVLLNLLNLLAIVDDMSLIIANNQDPIIRNKYFHNIESLLEKARKTSQSSRIRIDQRPIKEIRKNVRKINEEFFNWMNGQHQDKLACDFMLKKALQSAHQVYPCKGNLQSSERREEGGAFALYIYLINDDQAQVICCLFLWQKVK